MEWVHSHTINISQFEHLTNKLTQAGNFFTSSQSTFLTCCHISSFAFLVPNLCNLLIKLCSDLFTDYLLTTSLVCKEVSNDFEPLDIPMALIYGNFPWIPEACIEGNESTRNGGLQTIESSSF
jgi:hypothetical protein